mgnify:CR=1 FL=1
MKTNKRTKSTTIYQNRLNDDDEDGGDDDDVADDFEITKNGNEIEELTERIRDTSIRSSIETRVSWNPTKPFYVPKRARKFKPDWSFNEQENEREDYLEKHQEERVSFESAVGQTRFEFVMKTLGDDLKKKNHELVELVVTSLLRCTNCDVAKTLFRAESYFAMYADMFGCMSYKQTLDDAELRETVETGCFQVLENVDKEGRAIFWFLPGRVNPHDEKTSALRVLKMMNYVVIRTLRNYPTVQRSGLIILSDMGGLKFENHSFSFTRTGLFYSSNFLPARVHRICMIRPLYFLKFVLPAVKSFLFSGYFAKRVLILSQDPRDLLLEPLSFRAEILPPVLGGNNNSYSFSNRVRSWRLEEEHENEKSCNDSSHHVMSSNAANSVDTAENNRERNRGAIGVVSPTRECAEDEIEGEEGEEEVNSDTDTCISVSSRMSYHTAVDEDRSTTPTNNNNDS